MVLTGSHRLPLLYGQIGPPRCVLALIHLAGLFLSGFQAVGDVGFLPTLPHWLLEVAALCVFLITKVTKVSEVLATFPVTCQQPSVGKIIPLD